MKKNYTHMVMLLDSSSSMLDCWDETIKSLTTMFDEQKGIDGDMTFSLYTFNKDVETPYHFIDIKSITSLSLSKPLGWTALYKAFCLAVDETGSKLANLAETQRPEKVLFVVFTDGAENMSGPKYPLSLVKEKLKLQKDIYQWQFLFMGADFDAESLGSTFGLSADNCFNYSKSNTNDSFVKTSGLVKNYRMSASPALDVGQLRGLKADIGK